MSDDDKTIVDQPEVVQQQEVGPVTEEENPQQINWKKFREAREVERQQKIAAEKMAEQKTQEAMALRAALEAVVNKPAHHEPQEQPYESEEDIIEKKVQAALAKERQRIDEDNRKREAAEIPAKLNSVYKDFGQVCTEENLDYLEFHYPEVAKAFRYAPEGFEKWSDIYNTVKKFVPNYNSKKDEKKIHENLAKPQSMSRGGQPGTGDVAPHILSESQKKSNWERMRRAAKGV